MQSAGVLSISVDEDLVRRHCGRATFARADALQREGHVFAVHGDQEGLTARVRGTWQRVDDVTVQNRAGRLQLICSRDGVGYCRHTGAVLLHLVRNPSSFRTPTRENSRSAAEGGGGHHATVLAGETPEEEYARRLEQETMARLRAIGARRGIRVTGSRKLDAVRQLTAFLTVPERIEDAIRKLNREERRALDTAYIVQGVVLHSQAFARAFQAVGGTGNPPIASVIESGLVMSPGNSELGTFSMTVPRAVIAHLGVIDDLLQPIDLPLSGSWESSNVVELFQIIEVESRRDPITIDRYPKKNPELSKRHAPPVGFVLDESDRRTTQQSGQHLIPRSWLEPERRRQLATATGLTEDALEFVIRLMFGLGIAQGKADVSVRTDRLIDLLGISPADRFREIVQNWSAKAGKFEFGLLVSDSFRIRLNTRPDYGYASNADLYSTSVGAAIRLILRLIARLPPGSAYDLGSFVDLIQRLAPYTAPTLQRLHSHVSTWEPLTLTWLQEKDGEEPLALSTKEGWPRFLRELVKMIFTGPLTWLGAADAEIRSDQTGTIWIGRAAGWLNGASEDEPSDQSDRITIGEDLTVLVPVSTNDGSVHGVLSRAGSMIDASVNGRRYQLTRAGLHGLFESGTSGPEFVKMLAVWSGNDVPGEVVRELISWWQGYGAIRLYDELTLIEFGDDVLLPELLSVISLDSALIHTFSPRLIAIDPSKADQLVAELASRGYASRMVEDV